MVQELTLPDLTPKTSDFSGEFGEFQSTAFEMSAGIIHYRNLLMHDMNVHLIDSTTNQTVKHRVEYQEFFLRKLQELSTSSRLPMSTAAADTIRDLRTRLHAANEYFVQKTTEVMIDEHAVTLLAELYENVTIDIDDFDTRSNAMSLARLTAANFVEVGARIIHITVFGRKFIESLLEDDDG